MNTIKLILTAILLMMAYVANAQTIQFYKDGAVVKEYSSAEVDSVVYKPAAAQPRYYYYAGWDCPSSVEAEMKRLLSNQGCGVAGEITDFDPTLEKYTRQNPLLNYQQNPVLSPDDPNDRLYIEEEQQYYIMIPKGSSEHLNIYNYMGAQINKVFTRSEFTYEGVVYTLYKSKEPAFGIAGEIIYK